MTSNSDNRTRSRAGAGADSAALVSSPGMIERESSNPARIVSDSPRETEEALCAQNIRIVRSGALDLEEILSHLMRRSGDRHISSSFTGE